MAAMLPKRHDYDFDANPLGYSRVRCSDGVDVVWPYSQTPMSTLPSDTLLRMRGDFGTLELFLAHAEASRIQVESLYRRSKPIRHWGHRRRLNGQRIKAHAMQKYCEGLAESQIHRIFCRYHRDRDALLRELLRVS